MKMVYTYEVTIAVDLFAEPVVVEHTILADTRTTGAGFWAIIWIIRRRRSCCARCCCERTRRLRKRSGDPPSTHGGGHPQHLLEAIAVSVLSTCVTKQTGDMVYSEARWLWFLRFGQRTTMLYALERGLDYGSTSAVFGELSERRAVGSGPVSRVWDFASYGLPMDQSLQRDRAGRARRSQSPPT
jgi:hypothetical protein